MTPRRTARIYRRAAGDPHAAYRMACGAIVPNLSLARAPSLPLPPPGGREIAVATYNLHRWTPSGRRVPQPERASAVIAELDADALALQEVLQPFAGDDPLIDLAERLQLHLAFVATRVHRLGRLGNAILSRWPIIGISVLDLSVSRVEPRTAVAAQLATPRGPLAFVALHLSLVPRRRRRQVLRLLDHPALRGPVILAGDMNAWRRDRTVLALDAELSAEPHLAWPVSFPSTRPLWPLDRIYARGAKTLELRAHSSLAAQRASDHLPVVGRLALPDPPPCYGEAATARSRAR